MRIERLEDHPELVPTIARWRMDEWGHNNPGVSLVDWIEALEAHLISNQIPQSLIAMEDEHPIGVASLTRQHMETRKDLFPWLARVFVLPQFRFRGIAASLVRAIEHLAGDLGYEEIFLYTNRAEGLYKKLDWTEIGREEYKGREVVIMSKIITA